jgi:hypothetical protein
LGNGKSSKEIDATTRYCKCVESDTPKEHVKVTIIVLSNTSAHPWAVMVMLHNASITIRAMGCSGGSPSLARRTIPCFHYNIIHNNWLGVEGIVCGWWW